jgi:hypothetical protein
MLPPLLLSMLLLLVVIGPAAAAVRQDGGETTWTPAPVRAVPCRVCCGRRRLWCRPRSHTTDPTHHYQSTTPHHQIIGIFAQPSHAGEYIAASYIKWLEAAGARAVPIPYNASVPVLDALFARVNGLLLPGGGNPLPEAAVHMIGRALAANEAGDYFPVRVGGWLLLVSMGWWTLGGRGVTL